MSRREGSVSEIKEKLGRATLIEFKTLGFIVLGLHKWIKLAKADRYFIDTFGYDAYLFASIKFKIEIFMKTLANMVKRLINSNSLTPTGMIPTV